MTITTEHRHLDAHTSHSETAWYLRRTLPTYCLGAIAYLSLSYFVTDGFDVDDETMRWIVGVPVAYVGLRMMMSVFHLLAAKREYTNWKSEFDKRAKPH